MDETRIQCNKEPGRKAGSDSFMWVMRSGAGEELQGVFFHYSPYRNREVAKSLLRDYKGYLVTDAYVVYEDAGQYQHSLCFAHCRRYFIEAIPLDNKGKEIPGFKGAKATAVLYTLVESAKANHLDIYEYLKYLLEEMPNNRHLEYPEIIDRYLP